MQPTRARLTIRLLFMFGWLAACGVVIFLPAGDRQAEDAQGYMSRYSFDESIRDGATLPLRFEPRLVELHIDKEALDAAYQELTGSISDLDKETLARTAARMSVLVKTPERIERICADIARHFQEKVAPNGEVTP